MSLPPLADPDDVMTRAGRTLSPEEIARLPVLLGDSSAVVRNYCRNPFTSLREVQRLRPVGQKVRLPRKPVAAVHAVRLVIDTLLVSLPGFIWDGLDEVLFADPYVIINLPEAAYDWLATHDPVAEVDYTAGYTEIPPEVVIVVCSMVNRNLSLSSVGGGGAGVIQEAVGEYSYKLSETASALSVQGPVTLTPAEKQILDTYRPPATLVALRT